MPDRDVGAPRAGLRFWQMPGRARGLAMLCVLWAASWALLLLPDVLLYWSGYAVEAVSGFKAILFAAVVALLITTAKSRRFRVAVIAFLVLNQIIWTGYVVYFGQALSPEHLMLFQHEAADTVIGVLADWRVLMPWLITLLVSGAALIALQWREGANANLRWRVSGVAFIVITRGGNGGVDAASADRRAFPGKHTAAMYGPFQAAVGAVRMGLTHVAADNLNVIGQTQLQTPPDTEPVTVVVIMGESINPTRLSLYGFKADTTPPSCRMARNRPTGFTLIPQIGFSGGLDPMPACRAFCGPPIGRSRPRSSASICSGWPINRVSKAGTSRRKP